MQTEAGSESVADVLRAARKLIERPEAWTQGHYARDAYGREVDYLEDEPVCFCAIGAVSVAMGAHPDGIVDAPALDALVAVTGEPSIHEWNDAPDRTHAEVLAAFDAAIARAEGA